MWLRHPEFNEAMKKSWRDTHTGENIMEQLKKCGEGLTEWAKATFGSVRKRKK